MTTELWTKEELEKLIAEKKARMDVLVNRSGLPYYRLFKKHYFWTDTKDETEYKQLEIQVASYNVELKKLGKRR